VLAGEVLAGSSFFTSGPDAGETILDASSLFSGEVELVIKLPAKCIQRILNGQVPYTRSGSIDMFIYMKYINNYYCSLFVIKLPVKQIILGLKMFQASMHIVIRCEQV
jgi:hypothetical protein